MAVVQLRKNLLQLARDNFDGARTLRLAMGLVLALGLDTPNSAKRSRRWVVDEVGFP